MDLGIYTTEDVLEHKKRDGSVYWELTTFPKVEEDDRIWFATDGQWRGYFLVDGVDMWKASPSVSAPIGQRHQVEFDSFTWVECDGGPRRPFQGFTYKVPGR